MSFSSYSHCYNLPSKKLWWWYRKFLSGYETEEVQTKLHKHDLVDKQTGEVIEVPILKVENFGVAMNIDDKNLGGEAYTIISNNETGKIALMIKSVKVEDIKRVLEFVPREVRRKVKSIAKDLAPVYDWIARQYFSFADRVADKFHVLKLGFEALQAIRIRLRQSILRTERELTEARKKAKKAGTNYQNIPLFNNEKLGNGETRKELLARSRGLLFKFQGQWTDRQAERAKVLFSEYPELKQAYQLMIQFRNFYNCRDPIKARSNLKTWLNDVDNSDLEEIKNFAFTVKNHCPEILNYFDRLRTNAKAETLNSHIQRFFINNYGIRNRDFFHFRILTLFS